MGGEEGVLFYFSFEFDRKSKGLTGKAKFYQKASEVLTGAWFSSFQQISFLDVVEILKKELFFLLTGNMLIDFLNNMFSDFR